MFFRKTVTVLIALAIIASAVPVNVSIAQAETAREQEAVRPLPAEVIPPATGPGLSYSSFLGGMTVEASEIDSLGAVYLVGTPNPSFVATAGAYDTTANGGAEVCLMKLNPDGTNSYDVAYATFIGGTGNERPAASIAVCVDGSVVIAGTTESADFPVTNGAFDEALSSDGPFDVDAFVTKISPSGSSLLYSSYIGGTDREGGWGLAVTADSTGDIYLAGVTESADFPTTAGCYDRSYNDGRDGFLAKIHPASEAAADLVYSTYLDGGDSVGYSAENYATAIAVDNGGCAYVTGIADEGFTTSPGAYSRVCNRWMDMFVLKMNASGSAPIYSTYLGGDSDYPGVYEICNAIAVDDKGAAYLAGSSLSTDFPTTPEAIDHVYSNYPDGFVTKLSPSGSALEYSTLFGGWASDQISDLTLDRKGCVYVAGTSEWLPLPEYHLPTTPGSAFPDPIDSHDSFVAKLDLRGDGNTVLAYCTYLGGSSLDNCQAVGVDAAGDVYAVGYTQSADFPVTSGALQATKSSQTFDTFVTRLRLPVSPLTPVAGDEIAVGSEYTISWNVPPNTGYSNIELSTDGGQTFSVIGSHLLQTTMSRLAWPTDDPLVSKENCYIKITAYDANGVALASGVNSRPFAMKVADIVQPSGGEVLSAGDIKTIRWTCGMAPSYVNQTKLYYSTNGGASWTLIDTFDSASGSYAWRVPSLGASCGNCLIRAELGYHGYDNVAEAISPAPFTIKAAAAMSPSGGEVIPSGGKWDVTWNVALTGKNINTLKLAYSVDGGKSWQQVTTTTELAGSYVWDVPILAANAPGCLFRVRGFTKSGAKVFQAVSRPFRIDVVRVTKPLQSEPVGRGSNYTIKWETNQTVAPVKRTQIYYTKDGGVTWVWVANINGNPGSYQWSVPVVGERKFQCQVKVVLKAEPGPGIPVSGVIGEAKSTKWFVIM